MHFFWWGGGHLRIYFKSSQGLTSSLYNPDRTYNALLVFYLHFLPYFQSGLFGRNPKVSPRRRRENLPAAQMHTLAGEYQGIREYTPIYPYIEGLWSKVFRENGNMLCRVHDRFI